MRRWTAFALLCLVESFSWIALQHSGTGITAASSAVAAGIAAVVMMWLPITVELSAIGGACLVAGPWLGFVLGSNMPGSGAIALVLTLIPVVIAVAQPAMGHGEFAPSQLWPGLAAATGLLVIEPLPSFADWRTDLVLVLIPLVVGIGCVLAKQRRRENKDGAVALGVAAAFFAVLTVAQWLIWRERILLSAVAILVSVVTFVLLLLALRGLTARQYSAQFALVPLLALLQGPFVISTGVLTWRFVISVVLLGAAGAALLREGSEEKPARSF